MAEPPDTHPRGRALGLVALVGRGQPRARAGGQRRDTRARLAADLERPARVPPALLRRAASSPSRGDLGRSSTRPPRGRSQTAPDRKIWRFLTFCSWSRSSSRCCARYAQPPRSQTTRCSQLPGLAGHEHAQQAGSRSRSTGCRRSSSSRSRRRRRASPTACSASRTGACRPRPSWPQQLSAVLDDSLDDLRAEPDPRKAVIATYARMETAARRCRSAARGGRDAARVPRPRAP